jgi:hypothetical protein
LDNTADVSTYAGAFTTQIAGRTPAQIQANILAGGSERSTYSAEFLVTAPTPRGGEVPEPGTLSLLAVGGGLIAFAVRRRAAAR